MVTELLLVCDQADDAGMGDLRNMLGDVMNSQVDVVMGRSRLIL